MENKLKTKVYSTYTPRNITITIDMCKILFPEEVPKSKRINFPKHRNYIEMKSAPMAQLMVDTYENLYREKHNDAKFGRRKLTRSLGSKK